MAEYLVELYLPGAVSECAGVVARARSAAAQMASEGIAVRFVRAILVPEDESCFCLYEAPSAQAATEAVTRAALPFERVVPAVELPAVRGDGSRSTRPQEARDASVR